MQNHLLSLITGGFSISFGRQFHVTVFSQNANCKNTFYLLCVLAASLNISYMPAGGLLSISTCTLDGESFTIRQKTMPDGTKIAVYDGETSIVYAKYRGLTYTITEIQKPADGHWLPESIKVYRGSYSSPANT